jgi:hypothetical protein
MPLMNRLDLLPPPKQIRLGKGTTRTNRVSRQLTDTGLKGTDAYRLTIDKSGIHLEASSEAGLFYADQTLAQLRARFPKALQCLTIADWADYPVRGFYHDVARGKVPKLRTLLQLAETCARYKINHLELYVEHTFAFAKHPEVWQGADPLTREEILALDARCAELHIDLVPSFSTFGHFYTWIRNKFPELNELGAEASREPYCWRDRMQHYTLDCQNPRSIELVREIIREVRPLFRSRYFNICADETFDLGNGRNKALADKIGKGRLYVDFLNQIMAIVRELDATPLFWGDVIAHHPELVGEIGEDAIALDWDYDSRASGTRARMLEKAGRRFYECPGVSGWAGWLPDFTFGFKNIVLMAKHGLNHGASGLLNTDWGDFGHINTLGPTLPGVAMGAACAWNLHSPELGLKRFSETASRTIFGDTTGTILGLLSTYAASRKALWSTLCCTYQPHTRNYPKDWYDPGTNLPREFFNLKRSAYENALTKMRNLAPRIERLLVRCRPQDPLLLPEIRVGLLGQQVMEEVILFHYEHSGRKGRLTVKPRETITRLRDLKRQLRSVWLKRNKPSELYRIDDVLTSVIQDLAGKSSPAQIAGKTKKLKRRPARNV